MGIKITDYNLLCNIGNDVDEAFNNAVNGKSSFEIRDDLIKAKRVRVGEIKCKLPEINSEKYNIKCNRMLLKCLEKTDVSGLINKYGRKRIGIVSATTNTGVQEHEDTQNKEHSKISNPSSFIKDYYGLENYSASVSTACSSGVKAFSTAAELLNSGISDAVIVAGTDALSKLPIFGFDSLEILSENLSNPFSSNRSGINISEGAAVFLLEKDVANGVEILGIGETTDFYHSTTPDPEAHEAVRAINLALNQASLKPHEIDYINLHGTGTYANDLMEGVAIHKIFEDKVPASSTKPLTGHCLGAAASVEIALCAKLIENRTTRLYPHLYDGCYDVDIPKIQLVEKNEELIPVKNILCTSFGFAGTNTAIILGGNNG